MKTNLYPKYDETGLKPKDYGLLVTPEGGSIAIRVEGVPYEHVYSFMNTNYAHKQVGRKVWINTKKAGAITLEIFEVKTE